MLNVPGSSLGSVCPPPEKKKIYVGRCPECSKEMIRKIGGPVTCSDECGTTFFNKKKKIPYGVRQYLPRPNNKPIVLHDPLVKPLKKLGKKARKKLAKKRKREERRRLAQSKDPLDRKVRIMKEKYGDSFYTSREWLGLRYEVMKRSGGKCEACGRGRGDGAVLHVDHIKPRSKFPELELNLENLQILCRECNLGKSNLDQTDWR